MSSQTLSHHRHGILVECLAQRCEPTATSGHFALYPLDPAKSHSPLEDIVVVHDFIPDQIDNNIGYHVANELLPLLTEIATAGGHDYDEQILFEHYFGEIVRSMDGNEQRAWRMFYDNTLKALRVAAERAAWEHPPDIAKSADFISDFGAIYQRAIALVDDLHCAHRSVLDMATCFGFFPLLLADWSGRDVTVTGCDNNRALIDLAADYAGYREAVQVHFAVADILAGDVRRPGPQLATFDVVTAIHLLEHLTPAQAELAVANLWRLTGQRLIVAVPFEETPDARFGHQQVFDQQRLEALGEMLEGRSRFFEYHGGWLVVDRILSLP